MTDNEVDGEKPAISRVPLLTAWAEGEHQRLLNLLNAKEMALHIQHGRYHPETMPIHRNILGLTFAFNPARKRSTGRVRAFFVLWDRGSKNGAWPGLATIMREAGFEDRSNARKNVDDLHNANILTKTRRPIEGTKRFKSSLYDIEEGDLIDLAFAASNGATALYLHALRKIWVNEDGVGSCYLSRDGVKKALSAGVQNENNKPVLDRNLSDEKIVEHYAALLKEKSLLKLDHARLTIPGAEGRQLVKDSLRVWDRKDKGKPKPRRIRHSVFPDTSPPSQRSFLDLSPPRAGSAVSPPPPGLFTDTSPPPNRVLPDISPPELPTSVLITVSGNTPFKPASSAASSNIKKTATGSDVDISNHLSPHSDAGLRPLPRAGHEVGIDEDVVLQRADAESFARELAAVVGPTAPRPIDTNWPSVVAAAAAIDRELAEGEQSQSWALNVIGEEASRLVAHGRRFATWGQGTGGVRNLVRRTLRKALRNDLGNAAHGVTPPASYDRAITVAEASDVAHEQP
ncbi:hypothetical protein [Hyphomicrobium sp.]|jgi:hypothetical protein|uniref:hypothetical protein n=1 Tax=Hyphomicrobium sp. TaxID=82 RepID=UPI003564166E